MDVLQHNELVSAGKDVKQIAALAGVTVQNLYQMRYHWRQKGLEVLTKVKVDVKKTDNVKVRENKTEKSVSKVNETMEEGTNHVLQDNENRVKKLEQDLTRSEAKLLESVKATDAANTLIADLREKLKLERGRREEAEVTAAEYDDQLNELKEENKQLAARIREYEKQKAIEKVEIGVSGDLTDFKDALRSQGMVEFVPREEVNPYEERYIELKNIAKPLLEQFIARM